MTRRFSGIIGGCSQSRHSLKLSLFLRRYIRPGSTDPSIMYLQPRHRSEALWQGHDTPTVRPRRTRSTTFGYPPPVFVPLLIASDFYGASRAGFFPYDWHLVMALIMRWRPETHTFHMAVDVGETTITLEDVAIQLGLPIEGKAVVESTSHNWPGLCQELLGKTPTKPDIKGQRVKISWLEQNFPLDDGPRGDVSDEELRQMVQAYIVRLIGGFFYAGYLWEQDVRGDEVRLREHGRVRPPSACVGVGQISHPRAEVERAQGSQVERRGRGGGYPIPCPLSVRWSDYRTTTRELCMHNVTEYVLKMDNMSPANVVWQPYIGPKLNEEISSYYLHARDLGLPSCQFPWIQMWDQQWKRLVDAPKTTVPLAMHSHYMRWYKEITRKWVHPVGARTIVNGETFGVLADRVYEQPLPTDEIDYITRLMQTLNLHPDPEGAGDHEATSAPTFPYGPINGRDSSRSRPKKMSESHPLVPIFIQPVDDGEPAGHKAGGDDHQDDGADDDDDDEDELPDLEPQDFDALGAFLRTPLPSISQT
ncbi:serine/threonine-protein phosphatase 7 long form-like protein [Senna tora]|uniref:Serine/threonine-protein phosphatase 7 long form-like protein n=1 Tax=Senna tora TaxID=362788 RepID=A0A834W0T5_9FABA|nr:serine/threonine-protein phosphatase 7 long form-like protein [Senna tora]